MVDREARLQELLEYAKASEDVVGLYVFGSRGRRDGLADERSDYDVGVVLRDAADLEGFDARWPFEHGAPVEVSGATLSEFAPPATSGRRAHGLGRSTPPSTSGSTRRVRSARSSRLSGCFSPRHGGRSCATR